MIAILATVLVFAFAATATAADTIKIGVASPFTGGAASYGDNIKAGVSLKLEEINKAGGIDGKMIEIEWGDDLCEPKEGGIVGSKFAADKDMVAVLGHLCSSATLAALPIYVRNEMPVISPTSTNVTIGEVGKGWFFRNVYRDDFQGKFLAQYVGKVLGAKKVAVFHENNDYAIGLKEAFVGEAGNVGLEVIGVEAYVAATTDFTPQLTKLMAGKPDAIFLCGYYQEGALIAGQARKMGFTGPFFGADGIDNADYIKIAGPAADNTYMTVPFLAEAAGPDAQDFIARFKASAGRDLDWMSANAYDALGILAAVIKDKGADRKAIRDGLAAYNAPDKAYQGVTGATYFDANGDCQKPAFVKMVKGGEFVPAKQLTE
jgi:branched-chain amino acid transport system substrate-binding protein